jgi:hypothetical protein
VIAASPRDRYALATAAGPQRDPFDCQVSCRLNVAATGKRHARSTSSGVRVTDDVDGLWRHLGLADDQSPGAEETCGDENAKEVSALHASTFCAT